MIIHIVRHAEAIERSDAITEEHRYLTPRGRKRFRKIADSFKETGFHPEIILTSPLVRAVQTADILAETLRYKGDLPVADLLVGFRPQSLDKLLENHKEAKEIALVGHEPDLGILAQTLLETDIACTLKKGAVISFKLTAGELGKADFIQLVTGGGRVVTSRGKALERLQVENTKRTLEKGSI
jgi:phosphohistidine phosphatase